MSNINNLVLVFILCILWSYLVANANKTQIESFLQLEAILNIVNSKDLKKSLTTKIEDSCTHSDDIWNLYTYTSYWIVAICGPTN